MNFKMFELEDLFNKINEIINFIEKTNYSYRRQQIYFSNGEKITISTPNESIAHLIGINLDYLRSTRIYKNKNSFELLKEMSENAYTIYQAACKGIINYDKLFSKYILNKIEGFHQNIKIDTNDIEVVCKYNSEKNYTSGDLTEKYDYIIVKRYSNGKIGILGLVNNDYTYAPMSNQLYNSFQEAKENLEKYLKNQEITLINGLNLYDINSDYQSKFHPTINSKLEKFNILKKYKHIFNCSIDISGEYEFYIDKLVTRRETDYKDNDIIETIVESISKGKLIENESIDSSLKPIIDTFNDYLCSNIASSSDIKESYTDLKNNLENFKTKLLETEKVNNQLSDKNSILESENIELKDENKQLKENEKKILQILKPRI